MCTQTVRSYVPVPLEMERATPLSSYDWHLKSARTCTLRFERRRLLAESGGSRRYTSTTVQLLASSLLIIYQWAPEVCIASSENGVGELGAESRIDRNRSQNPFEILARQEENSKESRHVEDLSSLSLSNIPQTFTGAGHTILPAHPVDPNSSPLSEAREQNMTIRRKISASEREGEGFESSNEQFLQDLSLEKQLTWATPPQQVPVVDMGTRIDFGANDWETDEESVSDTNNPSFARSSRQSDAASAIVPLASANGAEGGAQSPLPPKYEDVLLALHSEGAIPPRLKYWELFDAYVEAPADETEQQLQLRQSLRVLQTWKHNLLATVLIVIILVVTFIIFSS